MADTINKFDARLAFDIDWSALAAGAAVASAGVANPGRMGIHCEFEIKSGAVVPVAAGQYTIYGLTHDGVSGTDKWTGAKGVITIENAIQIGSAVVTATADKVFHATFDWFFNAPTFGIALKNDTSAAIATDATEGATPEGVFKKGYLGLYIGSP